VIFSEGCDPGIREALRPLLDWRRDQASAVQEGRFRELWGEQGYQPGDTKRSFLERHEADLGAVDPDDIPYYLLLVGNPEQIPFEFQYELDLRHAVGRLDFDTVEEYARYAGNVVAVEKERRDSPADRQGSGAIFTPGNDDGVSLRMRSNLVGGLLSRFDAQPQAGWSLDRVLDGEATREELVNLMGGCRTPDFLFTACHGLVFGAQDPCQREKQGALLCLRGAGEPLSSAVSASEIPSEASLRGLITFHFACYGAGTPKHDDFGLRSQIAPRPFTARLPQRLLGGGALAVIGHVERAWTYSFQGQRALQIDVFEDVIRRLLQGEPVGWALELLNFRYAELAAELLTLMEREKIETLRGDRDWDLCDVYSAAKDARNYIVVGDPAARVAPTARSNGEKGEGDDRT